MALCRARIELATTSAIVTAMKAAQDTRANMQTPHVV
jgi:hypothetical protein